MTERQMHLCRILADPVSRSPDLHPADRAAVAAALAEIGRLGVHREGLAATCRWAQAELFGSGYGHVINRLMGVLSRYDAWEPEPGSPKAAPGEGEG